MKKVTIIFRNGVKVVREFEAFDVHKINGQIVGFTVKAEDYVHVNPQGIDYIEIKDV